MVKATGKHFKPFKHSDGLKVFMTFFLHAMVCCCAFWECMLMLLGLVCQALESQRDNADGDLLHARGDRPLASLLPAEVFDIFHDFIIDPMTVHWPPFPYWTTTGTD